MRESNIENRAMYTELEDACEIASVDKVRLAEIEELEALDN